MFMYKVTSALLHLYVDDGIQHVTPKYCSLLLNYEMLRRRFRMQRDNNDELNHKLRRSEMTTKSLDTELNSLKPEIKQLQAESANKFRCVAISKGYWQH